MAKRRKNLKIYKKNKKAKKIAFFFKTSTVLFSIFIFLVLFVFLYYAKELPRPENFLERNVFQSTKIYDRTGEILLYTVHGEEKREIISFSQMPEHLKKAVIAAEDGNFYQHYGIDFKGILRSVLVNLKLKKPAQGASTITQQLIRSSFLTREKTAERKIREIVLSLELERKYSKDQILEWYLNQIPFGSNAYGVEAASQTFFKKKAKDISLAEAAILAAVIQSPTSLSPYGKNKESLLKRKDFILEQMTNAGFITNEQKEEAQKEELSFADQSESSIKAPHFVLYVKNYLAEKYGEESLDQEGFKVYTTLDWELQKTAEKLVDEGVKNNKKYNAHNAALVAIDPNNGEILSLVGSADWFGDPYPENCISGKNCLFDPKFNIAIGTKDSPGRQPGSAFKPFAYVEAFSNGFTPETILWDVKTEFNPNCDSNSYQLKDQYGLDCYHPGNYDGRFRGPLSLRSSLSQSINVTSVKTLYLAGIESTMNLAQNMGITTLSYDPSRYGLSLVLGGGEVKLLEMVSAYGVFATEGLKIQPVSVLKIENTEGKIIEESKKAPRRVLEIQPCRMINSILSDNEARTPVFGPRSLLYFDNWQVAVKTGTTQEYKDGWTIGYTPSIAVGVWAGNNNNAPMAREPGVVLAAPIFHKFMEKALSMRPKKDFIEPIPINPEKPILKGEIDKESIHSILYYINKNDPQGPPPLSPEKDFQYKNWEEGIRYWLLSNSNF